MKFGGLTRGLAAGLVAAGIALTAGVDGDPGHAAGERDAPASSRDAPATPQLARGGAIVRQPIVAPHRPRPLILPGGRRVRKAFRWARRRAGVVSVAVIDTAGRMRRMKGRRLFVSASVAKAVMLAAYLRRHRRRVSPGARGLLRAMITWSDNNAAVSIYNTLGDEVIERTARRAGAPAIDVRGWWSEMYLSASAGARFMSKLRRVTPGRHRKYAMRLLAHIIPSQRFGIPDGIGSGWNVYFKGGWRSTGRGQLVHQIAVLHSGKRKISLAVLTDGNPSMGYGIDTIEGVARRLVPRAPRRR